VTSAENNQLIADVARDVVMQTEPGELPLFQAISKQYFKRPAIAVSIYLAFPAWKRWRKRLVPLPTAR
jgi:hypothetical protein